jgi:hypothetical protein
MTNDVREVVKETLEKKDGTFVHPLVQEYSEMAAMAFEISVEESDFKKKVKNARREATLREKMAAMIAEREMLLKARQQVIDYVKSTDYYREREAEAVSIEQRFLSEQSIDGLTIPPAMEAVYKDQVQAIRRDLSEKLAASKGDMEARIAELNDLIGDHE